jgi:hypothetical protein
VSAPVTRQDERDVVSAEAEGRAQRDVVRVLAVDGAHGVDVGVVVLVLEVADRRDDPLLSASTAAIASTAPAAPSRCPVQTSAR